MSRFVLTQLNNCKSFFTKILPKKLSQYHYRAFFVFLVIAFFVGTTKVVSAQSFESSLLGFFSSIVLAVSQLAIGLSIFFLRFFVTLASYNNYIDVSVVKLGWVMVRDVANMFFVVALLVIAFATILGIEKYEWKKSLVKIVLMAILINFSNLIAQIIIDAAHVFTITFLNAVSASAGGNLINMFNLEKINSLVQGADLGTDITGAGIEVIAASLISLAFAIATAVSLGSYAIVMTVRVVVLWALIILSPLAYLFSAMPKGEKYASRWWEEFTKHVIVAPVMVFFLWLAFATLGTGQIMSEIQTGNSIRLQQGTDPISISISEVSTWENMANYIIGFIFLFIGLKMTQETGAAGSGMVGSAINYGKQAFTIGSGYAFGRWMTGKGHQHGKPLGIKALKGTGKYFGNKFGVISGVERIKATLAEEKKNRIMRGVEAAKDHEDNARKASAEGKTGKAVWLSIKSWARQPHQRAAKQAEDWKKAADAFKESWEESLSTSDTTAGNVKQNAYAERDEIKAKAQQKIAQKQQERKILAAAVQEQMEILTKDERVDFDDAEKNLRALDEKYKEDKNNLDYTDDKKREEIDELKKQFTSEISDLDKTSPNYKQERELLMKEYTADLKKIREKETIDPSDKDSKKAALKAKYQSDKDKILELYTEDGLIARKDTYVDKVNTEYNDAIAKIDSSTKTDEEKAKDKEQEEIRRSTKLNYIKNSHDIAMGLKGKIDKKFEEKESKAQSIKDPTEKAKALAKVQEEKMVEFNKKFKEEYANHMLRSRPDAFFDYAGLQMAGGDEKKGEKKKASLRRNMSIGQLWDYSQRITKEQKIAAESQAVAEEIGKNTRQSQELRTAQARDKLRLAKGGKTVFEQQIIEKHFKERKEELEPLNYREITKQGAEIVKALSKGMKLKPGMLEELSSIVVSAFGRGSEEGAAAMDGIWDALHPDGKSEKISTDDMIGQQRKMMSILLGEKIGKADNTPEQNAEAVEKAFEKFQKEHGDDKSQAILKFLDGATKSAGQDGLLHTVGLLDDTKLDEKGRVKIKMQTSQKGFRSSRDYVANRQKPSTLTGVDGMVNVTNDNKFTINVIDNKTGKSTDKVDSMAYLAIKKTMESIKKNTQLTAALKTQIKKLAEDDRVNFDKIMSDISDESRGAIEQNIFKKTKSSPSGNAPSTGGDSTPIDNNPPVNIRPKS